MYLSKQNRTIIKLSLITLAGGFIVMLGWFFHIFLLQCLFIGDAAMKFNAALCFILFSCALLVCQYQPKKYRHWLYVALSFVATIIGLITFCEDVFHINTGLDQLFITDHTPIALDFYHTGRMALNSSISFSLLGVAFIMLIIRKHLFDVIAQYIFHLVSLLAAIAITGYLFNVSLFKTFLYITAMPPHTAVLFFTLSVAASVLHPSLGISKIFTGNLVGNQMARRLFMMMLLMILLFAALTNRTRHSQILSSMNIELSLLAVFFLLASLLMIWNTAVWLNKIDIKRYEAEASVKQINAELEKRVEERSAKLKEAELKFRTLADRSMVGVYIVQYDTFTYVNPRFAHIFGYEPEELINCTNLVEKIFHESYHATITENVRRRLSGEVESSHYEAIGKKKDGTTNWIEVYGNAVTIDNTPAIIGSMVDITERKTAEEELKSSEMKYKLLFESNPMPMWMIDKGTMSIIAANNSAAKLYGYSKDELLNLDTRSLRLKEDAQKQLEGYRMEADGLMGIVQHLKKDGTIISVQIIAHDIVFEGRQVRLSLTNDVTEKLKAEESLQKSEANLQAILKTTDTAYALFDRQLNVLAFNQKAAEFLSVEYGQKANNSNQLADYFPEDRFPDPANLANDVLKGKNINFEIDFPKGDTATWYYVRLFPITNDHKAILGVLMALYDITERKNAEQDLKTAYGRIQSHINSIKDMAWKQSHLIRSPLANLKGLTSLLKGNVIDKEVLGHIENELNRMDAIIIEMAEDASGHGDYPQD